MTVIWDDVHAEPCIRLTSPGFTITPYRQDDAGSLRALSDVPDIAARAYRNIHDPESTIRASLEKARPWLDALELALRDPESPSEPILGFPFAAVRDPGGKLVGKVSLAPFEHDPRGLSAAEMLARTPAEQTWILGYKLHPEARGKGVASAAVQAIVNDWVRVYMRIGQVVAGCELDNAASLAVLRKAGFVQELELEIPWPSGGTRRVGHFVLNLHGQTARAEIDQ